MTDRRPANQFSEPTARHGWVSAHSGIPFGLSVADGRMLAPLEAPLGKHCGCICPACRDPIIAKHCVGSAISAHFAHQANANCSSGFETALHLAAKQLIAERRLLHLPPLVAELTRSDRYGHVHEAHKMLRPGSLTELDDVRLEMSIGDFRPDVRACSADIPVLLIEIAVFHFVDEIKLAKIERAGLPALEVDLSALAAERVVDFATLASYLFDTAPPTRWLHHPALKERDAELRAELAVTIGNVPQPEQRMTFVDALDTYDPFALTGPEARQYERERYERERAAETAAKADRDAIARQRAGMAAMKAADQAGKTEIVLKTLRAADLPNVLRLPVKGGQSFGVSDPLIWQTALFLGIVHQRRLPASGFVTKNEALAWLANRFSLTPSFPSSAEIAVWGYLVQLTELGALYRWRKAEFVVGVYSLGALHTFLTIKGKPDVAAIGLEWTDPARWPTGPYCDHLVCAMLGAGRIPAEWYRLVNRLRIWGAATPHDACAGAKDFGINPAQALEFFARAGMLRVV